MPWPDLPPVEAARFRTQRPWRRLADDFDLVHGGLGSAPKFPHVTDLERLLRHYAASRADGAPDREALHMVTFTLERMIRGGL